MGKLKNPIAFERGDKLYLVGPVGKIEPTQEEIGKFAFGSETVAFAKKDVAPNPAIAWMRGQYVEADIANANGDQWQADDLAIKALTPMLMPVTVMHDFRTAVGTIADTRLLTPGADQIPRSKIETTLALWSHRFPDVVEEALHNAAEGTLMQSMECIAPSYSCSVCGMAYQRLAYGAEREQWCEHLAAPGANASRILANVCFTGTGLIFGTRGSRGADPEAHLEVFQETVAELHTAAHTATETPSRRTHRMETVEIAKTEHERLTAADRERESLKDASAEKDKTIERLEAEKKTAEDEKAAAEKTASDLKAEGEKAALAEKRLGDLGEGFKAKFGENTAKRVKADAADMSDEDWESRVAELEETLSIKRDAKADGKPPAEKDKGDGEGDDGGEDLFEAEQISAFDLGKNGQDPIERSAVVGGLMDSFAPTKPEPATK